MPGAEPGETLALDVERALEGLGELSVVHGHDPQPGLELADFHLSSGQFQVDGMHEMTPGVILNEFRKFLKLHLQKIRRARHGRLRISPVP